MDVVADFRAPAGRAARIDLTEDPAILTAIANDIGVEAIFSRQVIAYGGAGDALLALSTSGNSGNVIAGARPRRAGAGCVTIAMVGYDGGADRRARGSPTTSSSPAREHIPRIQEAQASAYHALGSWWDERRAPSRAPAHRVRVNGTVQGVGFRPYVYRLAGELGLGGFVLNDAHGVLLEVEGDAPARSTRSSRGCAPTRRRSRCVERVVDRGARAARRRARLRDPREPARRGRRTRRSRPTARPARTACASCSTRPTAATATRSSTARTAARGSRSSAASPTTGR